MCAQSLLHLADNLRFHTKIGRNVLDLGLRHPTQSLSRAPQIEEQLALRLGGGDLGDPPVAQNELVNLRPDPVNRKGDEPNSDTRVETLDRLHQADIALLNQIRL